MTDARLFLKFLYFKQFTVNPTENRWSKSPQILCNKTDDLHHQKGIVFMPLNSMKAVSIFVEKN